MLGLKVINMTKKYAWVSRVLVWILTISCTVASLALNQAYDCSYAREISLKFTGKYIYTYLQQNNITQNQCTLHGIYCI